jgi:hypothetical protein
VIGAEFVSGADSACRRSPAVQGPLVGGLASHNQKDAEGFIRLNALRLRTGAKRDRRG